MLEKICKAELSDLQDIAALESEIFSDAWSLKSLEETWNQKNAVIFAAKTEEKIAGYLITVSYTHLTLPTKLEV